MINLNTEEIILLQNSTCTQRHRGKSVYIILRLHVYTPTLDIIVKSIDNKLSTVSVPTQ